MTDDAMGFEAIRLGAAGYPVRLQLGEAETAEVEVRVAGGTSLGAVRAAIDLFQTAVRWGMFSAGRSVSLEIDEAPVGPDGALRQRWRVGQIDPGAWRILLNLLDTLHLHGRVALESVEIAMQVDRLRILERAEIAELGYPKRLDPAPFDIWLKQRLAGAEDVLVRLEFARALDDADFEAIEPGFTAWNRLITHGAYGDACGEVELDDSLGCAQTYMAAPTTLEHEFVRGVAKLAAFEALLNLAGAIDRAVCRLRLFEIT